MFNTKGNKEKYDAFGANTIPDQLIQLILTHLTAHPGIFNIVITERLDQGTFFNYFIQNVDFVFGSKWANNEMRKLKK